MRTFYFTLVLIEAVVFLIYNTAHGNYPTAAVNLFFATIDWMVIRIPETKSLAEALYVRKSR